MRDSDNYPTAKRRRYDYNASNPTHRTNSANPNPSSAPNLYFPPGSQSNPPVLPNFPLPPGPNQQNQSYTPQNNAGTLPSLEIPSFFNDSNNSSNPSGHPSSHGASYSPNQPSYDPRSFQHQSGQRVTTRSQYRNPESPNLDNSNNNPNNSNPNIYAQSSISPLLDPQLTSGPLNSSQQNLEAAHRRGTFGTFGPTMQSTGTLPPISSLRHPQRYDSLQGPNTSVGSATNAGSASGSVAGVNVGTSSGAPPPPVHPPPTHAFRSERDSTTGMVRRGIGTRGGGRLGMTGRNTYNNTSSYHGGQNHHNNHPNQQNTLQHFNNNSNIANANNNTNDGSLAIRNINPVKEALALLKDANPITLALSQTVLQNGSIPLSPVEQRNAILNFKGFPPDMPLRAQYLIALSRSDLDILAWVFVVPKHGKKEELANRILQSLRAPLTYRVPAVGRRPHIPARIEARPVVSTSTIVPLTRGAVTAARGTSAVAGATPNTSASTTIATRTRAQQQQYNSGNSPNTPNGNLTKRDSMMQTLTRHLEAETSGTGPDIANVRLPTSGAGARGSNSGGSGNTNLSGGRFKQTQLSCTERLRNYDFRQGENPFNEPLDDPLGEDKFVYFSSAQLSRGTDDPILRFHTPAPVNDYDDPRIAGGAIQVHLRCLRVEVEKQPKDWKQAWPFPASCRVNGHAVQLNQAQRYTNGKLAGRDAATNITGYLRKFSGSALNGGGGTTASLNKVMLRRQISSATPTAGQYVLFAQQILVHGHDTMLENVQRLSEKYWADYRRRKENRGELLAGQSNFDMAKQGVQKFLDGSDGVTLSSMKVSLRCPLALIRMEIPVKGRDCHHVQCFDLGSFLEYSRRSCKFECPVCNKPTAHPSTLIKSPYIEHALKMFPDCDEVEVIKDGSLVAVERQQTGIASDDEDSASASVGRSRAGGSNATSAGNGGASGQGSSGQAASTATNRVADVVDLTLDSDDETPNGGGNAEIVPAPVANGRTNLIPLFSNPSRTPLARNAFVPAQSQYGQHQQETQPEQQSKADGLDQDDDDIFTFDVPQQNFINAAWNERTQGQGQSGQQPAQMTQNVSGNAGVRQSGQSSRPTWTANEDGVIAIIDSDSD